MAGLSMNPLPRSVSRLAELAHDVVELKDTAAMRAMRLLLEEIDGQTLELLRDVAPDRLLRQQGKLDQLDALLKLLRGEPSNGMA